ncbi:MAG: restriction endonuclease subunit S, partial [Candidatus Riflebacteria bacterium]|nr:restriction endonuclease subunit S [Candidatus Riflebacteria bacterium]
MIDTNALRKKILEFAVQGKLTQGYRENPFNRAIAQKNCPHEGGGSGFGEAKDERGLIYLSAEELYNQIQAEKQRLIAEGKIKKDKPLPPIKEEEIPFEIPRTWKWVRLGEVTNYAAPKKKVKPQNVDDDTWSLDLEDIEKNTGKVLLYVKAKERKILADKAVFYKGNILYSKLRPYLKKILVAHKPGVCSSEIVPFSSYGNFINAHFLVYFLMSPQVDYLINSVTYGIKMPRVGTETMTNLLLPLPPLSEQYRIVETIEKSFKELSIIDEMQKSLSTDAVSFKKKILELAIQGNLVEQRLEDGNAEELYNQIQTEKQRLIAEGKIKKEKPLPPIKEEEIPFEIPRTWKWVRFGNLLINRDSERIPLSSEERKNLEKKYDYYGASGVIDKVDNYIFDKTLLLIGEDGANLLARSTPIAFLAKGKYWVNNHAHVLDCNEKILSLEYIMHYINAINLTKYVTGTAQPKMNQEKMNSIPIP